MLKGPIAAVNLNSVYKFNKMKKMICQTNILITYKTKYVSYNDVES